MVCFVGDIWGLTNGSRVQFKSRSMATKINPLKHNSAKSQKLNKQELLAWKKITMLAKEKRGVPIALYLLV